MKSALLIEDDPDLADLVAVPLRELDFDFDHAADGLCGLELAREREYDLILLDLRLPKMDGIEVCKGIREKRKSVPLIMLTSVDDPISKVLLLELGADDYITKPFNVYELKARIKAVLRRAEPSSSAAAQEELPRCITIGNVEIDLAKRRVLRSGELIELTAREFDLVAFLASKAGCPCSREELLEATYGYEVSGYDQSISSHINRIRSKLELNPAQPVYILTVRGVGYTFADLEP